MNKKDRIGEDIGGLTLIAAWFAGSWQGVLKHRGIGEIKRVIGESLSDVHSQLRAVAESEDVLETLKSHVKEKHQERLRNNGLPYGGYLDGKANRHRLPHCYVCKQTLDNYIDLVCGSCGWIICGRDGACGCGYDVK